MSRQYKQNAAKKRLKFMPSSYKFKLVLLKLKGSRAIQHKFKPFTQALNDAGAD